MNTDVQLPIDECSFPGRESDFRYIEFPFLHEFHR